MLVETFSSQAEDWQRGGGGEDSLSLSLSLSLSPVHRLMEGISLETGRERGRDREREGRDEFKRKIMVVGEMAKRGREGKGRA